MQVSGMWLDRIRVLIPAKEMVPVFFRGMLAARFLVFGSVCTERGILCLQVYADWIIPSWL